MASPAEHLYQNTSWSAVFKRPSTWKMIGFVVLAAVTIRLGSFIPLPGVNNDAWSQFWAQSPFAKLLGVL